MFSTNTRSRKFHRFHNLLLWCCLCGSPSQQPSLSLEACLAFFASLAALIACSRWAFLTLGFWLLLAIISARDASVMALWNLHHGFLSFEFLPTVPFCASFIEESPVYLSWIPLGKECQLAFCLKKLENLPVVPGVAPPWPGWTLHPLKLHSPAFTATAAEKRKDGESLRLYFIKICS